MKKQIQIKCPAKINLSLDVVNRREDGYHNLSMIMQEIKLFDTLTFEIKEGNGVTLTADNPIVPTDNRNLIVKAAERFLEKTGITAQISIHLSKKIPMGAGLGGGSTDAAGTLKALSTIFDEPLSTEELAVMAKSLGADVPFFLYGGCMLAEGIGEKLTPTNSLKDVHIVVAKPPIHVSTAYVYKNLHLDENTIHPDTHSVLIALENNDLDLLAKSAGNVLETVTVKDYPEIEAYKTVMKNHGAAYSLMSGSGSSVFGVFKDESSAKSAFDEFSSKTKEVYLV